MKAEILLALRRLIGHKKMLFFIIVALALASANVIVTEGYIMDMNKILYETVVQYSVGDIVLRPQKDKLYLMDVSDQIKNIEQMPGIQVVSKRIESTGTIVADGKYSDVALWAFIPSKEKETTGLDKKISRGVFLDDTDKNKVVVGKVLADNLNVNVGDDIDITFRDGVTKKYNVKGILFSGVIELDRSTVFLTYDSLKEALNLSDVATKIVMRLRQGYDVDAYKIVLMQLNLNGIMSSGNEEARAFRSAMTIITATMRTLNFISLIVGAIMVGIILYINVVESTREIGILRAIGMQSNSVALIFIVQALSYSVLGGAFGIFLGFGYTTYSQAYPIIIPVTNSPTYSQFDIFIAFRGFVLTIVVSLFAALYPAYRASRTNIIKAIRHE